MTTPTFSVLIEQAGDWWVAQGIEHDLVTQAESLAQLEQHVFDMVDVYLHACARNGEVPFQGDPGPADARKRFEESGVALVPRLPQLEAVTIAYRLGDVGSDRMQVELARGSLLTLASASL